MIKVCQTQQMTPYCSFKGTFCYTARVQRFGAVALMEEIAVVLYLAGHVLCCGAMASLKVCLYLSLWAVMVTEGSGVLAVTTDTAGRPAFSGKHVVPMRTRPRARNCIPWRGRLSFRNGWAMSQLGQDIAAAFVMQVFTESKPAMSVFNSSSDK